MEEKIPVLGIDLGGTKISAALVQNHKLKGEAKRIPTPQGADNIINALLELIAQFQSDNIIFGVGIATAGIVNPNSGQVIGSTGNIPGWEGTAVRSIIQARTAIRLHVENDANAAAFGEYKAAEDLEGKNCIVAVTLGTGIGVGIVIEGQLYRGGHFAAGECGHIKISMENRRRCTCGLWDCWEAYGAGRGLQATAWELLEGVEKSQTPLAEKRETLKTQDVVAAAKDGDVLAQRAVNIWHEHVANGLVSLCHTLDPDVFVVTGGMSKFVDYAMLRDLVADRTLPRVSEKLEIRPSVLGEGAGMVGAAELVINAAQREEQGVKR